MIIKIKDGNKQISYEETDKSVDLRYHKDIIFEVIEKLIYELKKYKQLK